MKRVMFYCQHVLGMGHPVRSAEVVKALSKDFKVLFVVGGETTQDFPFPDQIELLQLRPLKTDPSSRASRCVIRLLGWRKPRRCAASSCSADLTASSLTFW